MNTPHDNFESIIDHIRLMVSGDVLNPERLPETVIDAIIEAIKHEPDPHAIIASYAYIFCGMRINDIRDRFVLSDQGRTRIASREYVRQKIVVMFQQIYAQYYALHNTLLVSPKYSERNIMYELATNGRSMLQQMQEDAPDEFGSFENKSGKRQKKKHVKTNNSTS